MLQKLIAFHSNPTIDYLIKVLVLGLLVCFVGPVVVRMENQMPITLQTLVILFVSIGFGWKVGGTVAALYVALGLAGVPVFAGYLGGIGYMNGDFGGFLFGFIGASLITGMIAEHPKSHNAFAHIGIWILGHVIVLFMGGFWLRSFNPTGWWDMITMALPGAAIKSAFGFFIIQIIKRIMMRRKEFYA